jgi:nucleotide-binding universal stress UspA family protein
MKRIVIPVDFSKVAENAIEYSMAINRKINAEIIFLHSYYIPVPTSEAAVVLPDKEMRANAIDLTENLRNKYQYLFPDTTITAHVTDGFPDIEILRAEKTLNADLVIMGIGETNSLRNFLMGSNTSAVIEKSVCPLICVPEHAKFVELNTIVFASNYGIDDFKNVFDLIDFAKPFNAKIILLHVSDGKHEKAFDFNQIDSFKNQIQIESGYSNLSFKLLEEESVYDGINNYLSEIKADMFAISMRNRSFIQNVFKPGLTKKMVYHTHTPVMIFHTDLS